MTRRSTRSIRSAARKHQHPTHCDRTENCPHAGRVRHPYHLIRQPQRYARRPCASLPELALHGWFIRARADEMTTKSVK